MSPTQNADRIAIRQDWGTAVEVEPGLFRLRLFNPRGALLINTYIYKSPGHLSVIDPGWPWTLDGLTAALKDLGLGGLKDVDQWLYTHTHIDHMGLAAILQKFSDAPHRALSSVERHLKQWHAFQDECNNWFGWGDYAFAEPQKSMLLEGYKARKSTQAGGLVVEHGPASVENADLFEISDTIQAGDLTFKILDARGHDPYHVAFYEPERKWMVVGDAVIATPTPISRAMNDDMVLYEDTLARLSQVETKLLLPGHGVQKTDRIAAAFAKSRGYTDHYRAGILQLLQDTKAPLNLYEIGIGLTPKKAALEPTGRWWVHLALADSHLQHIIKLGKVEASEGPHYRIK